MSNSAGGDRAGLAYDFIVCLRLIVLMAIIPDSWPTELTSAIASVLLTAGAMEWLHRRDRRLKDEEITKCEKLISEYRIRLSEEFPKSVYSKLSNSQLCEKAQVAINRIYKLAEEQRREMDSEEGPKAINLSSPVLSKYREEVHPQVLVLLSELNSRLPEHLRSSELMEYLCLNPISPETLEVAAADLLRLIASLPL